MNMIKENDTTGFEGKPEFYLSKIYDRFIKNNFRIDYVNIDLYWILGTPRQIDKFNIDLNDIVFS